MQPDSPSPNLPSTRDRIDREILATLQDDARISNKELARKVNLAPSSCLARVTRLIEQGWITGFHAAIDPEMLGLRIQAVVFVQLVSPGGPRFEAVRRDLMATPEVVSLFRVGGAQDLLVHVVARDTEHLRRVVLEGIANRPEVRHMETNIVFEHHRGRVPVDLP